MFGILLNYIYNCGLFMDTCTFFGQLSFQRPQHTVGYKYCIGYHYNLTVQCLCYFALEMKLNWLESKFSPFYD